MHDLGPITAIAAAQHGMLLTGQATAVGLDARDLLSLVRSGRLRHITRGLYALETLVEPDRVAWHRQLCVGALLLYPDAVLTGVSAVIAHEVDVWGVDLARPEVLRPVARTRTHRVRVRRTADSAARTHVVQTASGPTVPLADAIVQLAMDAGTMPGIASLDCALRQGKVSIDAVEAALERVATWPRSSRALAMIRQADGQAESVAESRGRVQAALGGIRLIPQVTITDERGRLVARVDFVVEGTRIIVEVDGRLKYHGDDGTVLYAEKLREDRLRALGYLVVRITWHDLETPGAVVAKIRRAMAQAA